MTNRMQRTGRSIFGGISLYLGGGVVAAVLNIVLVPFYLRQLGREGYGLVGFWVTVTAIISLFDLGASATVTRELARCTDTNVQRDLLRSMEMLMASLVVAIGGVGFVAAESISRKWFGASHIPPDTLATATRLLVAASAAQLLVSLYTGALIAKQKHAAVSAIQVFGVLLRNLGAAAAIAWYSRSVTTFFVWQLFGMCVVALLFRSSAWHSLQGTRRACFSVPALKAVTGFAFGMMGISVTSVVLTHIDKLLLSRWLSLSQFGTYSVAWTAASALLLIVGPFFRVFAPRFSDLHSRTQLRALRADYYMAAKVLGLVVCCLGVFVAVNAKQFLYVWTGNEAIVSEAGPILCLLVLGSMCNALMSIPFAVQLAYGWTRFTLFYNAVAIVALVPLLWLAVEKWGLIGGASIWIIVNASYVVLALPYVHRKLFGSAKIEWLKVVVLAAVLSGIWAALCEVSIARQPNRILQAAVLVLEFLPIGAAVAWRLFKLYRESYPQSPPAMQHTA